MGYLVKVFQRQNLVNHQFLKHSCSIVDGEYEPWVNIGTFFRGYGSKYGECSGRGPYVKRAYEHVQGVAWGRREWGDHCINDAFISTVKRPVVSSVQHDEAMRSTGAPLRRIPNHSICERYDVTEHELLELCAVIRVVGLGAIVNLPIVHKFYAIDYG